METPQQPVDPDNNTFANWFSNDSSLNQKANGTSENRFILSKPKSKTSTAKIFSHCMLNSGFMFYLKSHIWLVCGLIPDLGAACINPGASM